MLGAMTRIGSDVDEELRRFLLGLRPTDFPLVFPGRTRAQAQEEARRKNEVLATVLRRWWDVFPATHGCLRGEFLVPDAEPEPARSAAPSGGCAPLDGRQEVRRTGRRHETGAPASGLNLASDFTFASALARASA